MSVPTPSRREALLALVLALCFAAWPVRKALLDSEQVFFGVESAASFLPWSAELESAELPREQVDNPDLVDQTVVFYPFYRWVARSWLAGDPPAWCPEIYAGAPGIGNAQSGALDPQVGFLVALEALGGRELFDRGLGIAAWLRIATALLGAYLLARRLGLGVRGSLLAGLTFGYSGYLILWLNHALGHVPPLLPWVLFFLEGLRRGNRPLLGAAGVALALALAILGGHLETGFFVGVASGLWALALLRENPARGALGLAALALGALVACASLLPSYEYLELSAAKFVRELSAAEARAALDYPALGILLVLCGIVLVFRRMGAAREDASAASRWVPASMGLAFAFGGALLFFSKRGLEEGVRLALVPEWFGKPGTGAGFLGSGYYLEVASPWIVFPGLAFAFVALLQSGGHLRRRGLVTAVGILAFLLSIELPGLLQLYRWVPFVGLGDTVRFASVSALMIGLLAGEGLERSTPAARRTVALVLLAICGGFFLHGGVTELEEHVPTGPENDELIEIVLAPERHLAGERSRLEGWLHRSVPVDRARIVLREIDAGGRELAVPPMEIPLNFFPAPSFVAKARLLQARLDLSAESRLALSRHVDELLPDVRWFRTPFLLTDSLEDGHWSMEIEFFIGASTEPVAVRRVGVTTIERAGKLSTGTGLVIGLTLLALVLPWGSPLLPALLLLVALLQAFFFSEGLNPTVPRERVFPATRTEAILRAELGVHRFFTDPGVLPPSTGLVSGVRGIEGYDGMDVAEFNHYRNNVFPPGFNTLLAWNARGVDTRNVAFRLFGVGMLVLAEPFEHDDWQLVASPVHADEERRAETWMYRARAPLPRAFCVPRVISTSELGQLHAADPTGWDPLSVAGIDGDWRPASACTWSEVSEPRISNNEVGVSVELDGDGLLVVTEQAYPGWRVYVDGEERPLLTANMIFRGVALGAGQHEVVFRYESRALYLGTWISCAALAVVLLTLAAGLRQGRSPVPPSS